MNIQKHRKLAQMWIQTSSIILLVFQNQMKHHYVTKFHQDKRGSHQTTYITSCKSVRPAELTGPHSSQDHMPAPSWMCSTSFPWWPVIASKVEGVPFSEQAFGIAGVQRQLHSTTGIFSWPWGGQFPEHGEDSCPWWDEDQQQGNEGVAPRRNETLQMDTWEDVIHTYRVMCGVREKGDAINDT